MRNYCRGKLNKREIEGLLAVLVIVPAAVLLFAMLFSARTAAAAGESYTVKYHLGGGVKVYENAEKMIPDFSSSSVEEEDGEVVITAAYKTMQTYALPGNFLAKNSEGKIVTAWTASENGTGARRYAGAPFKNLGGAGSTVDLYAVWSKPGANMYFDESGYVFPEYTEPEEDDDEPESDTGAVITCAKTTKEGKKLYVDIAGTIGKTAPEDGTVYLAAINQNTKAVEYIVTSADGKSAGDEISYRLALGNDTSAGMPFHRYEITEGPSEGTRITAVMPMYALAVLPAGKNGNKLTDYQVISGGVYVSSPEDIAYTDSYNEGRSKKGIQGSESVLDVSDPASPVYVNEEYADVSHVFMNRNVSELVQAAPLTSLSEATTLGYNYEYNGKYYKFNDSASPAGACKILNEKGVSTTVQINLDYSDLDKKMIHSKARTKGKKYYSWENSETEGREMMEALFCWLGEQFAGVGVEDGYVSNIILGNEVNSCNAWHYKGSMSDAEFFGSYAQTYRALYNAMKSYNAGAKVYVCVDQCFNTAEYGYSAKNLLDRCNNLFAAMENGTMDWNIAAHPYSHPLTAANLWTGTGSSDSESTTYITMYNLSVLTDYISKKYVHTGSDGSSKTPMVILSEQGWKGKNNETNQAASLVYGYYISACNPLVTAFEIRALRDDSTEAAAGLTMGLLNDDGTERESLKAYRYCDYNTSYAKEIMADRAYYKNVNSGAASWADLKGISSDYENCIYRSGDFADALGNCCFPNK